jgi:toxin YoeB
MATGTNTIWSIEARLHAAWLGRLHSYRLQADGQVLKRIKRLIDDALRDPTDGIGKPEPLKHMLAGTWSRRITDEHRLVYLVDEEDLVILQARFHYT